MGMNRRLLDAIYEHEMDWKIYLEKSKILDEVSGEEKVRLQNELADWIETTSPKRKWKPPVREFSETEKNAINIVFGDSLNGTLMGAGGKYEALKHSRIVDLYYMNLDVGYIDQPEDSDYRKIASWRLAHMYTNESDEELLEWSEKNGENLNSVLEEGLPLRIWYSEEPRELCGFYYLCSLLKYYPNDVFAVRIPERICYEDKGTYRLTNSTGNLDPDNAGVIVESAVKLSHEELGLYADEWERLKRENSILRTVISGKIVSVEEDFYDKLILGQFPAESLLEEQAFDKVARAYPFIQQGWITLRIQKMIDDGKILVMKDNRIPARRLICRQDD